MQKWFYNRTTVILIQNTSSHSRTGQYVQELQKTSSCIIISKMATDNTEEDLPLTDVQDMHYQTWLYRRSLYINSESLRVAQVMSVQKSYLTVRLQSKNHQTKTKHSSL